LGLAILFAFSARQPTDVLYAFNFVAFLIYAPLATLFGRAAAPRNAERVAQLALLGAALGCAISLVEVFGLGAARAGLFITDTIRLADTAELLGFLALIGLVVRTDRRRWLYLLGPVLALIVLLLTGARAAMLTFPVLALASAFFLVRHKWLAAVSGIVAVALIVGAGLAGVFGSARLDSIVEIFGNLAAGNPVGDEAMRIRIELYKAGWAAFQQSPLVGHGWARLMSSAALFLAEADKIHATLPHLHNDMLNFAVFGGLAGVAIYLALIAAPIVLSLRSPRDAQYRARLFGSIVLVLGYIVMGLPDTMLSFDLHTALYVALTAILLAYCRDTPEPASR
jgi:O-antigen ligase